MNLKLLVGLIICIGFSQSQAQSFVELTKEVAQDRGTGDEFGFSVSISGDYAVVGAYAEDSGGSDTGAAYVFKKDVGGTNWTQIRKLTASNAGAGDYFGYSVAIDGSFIVVGAYEEDSGASDGGAAYIFSKDEGGTDNWGQVKILTASDAQANDLFGFSVSISGEFVIVSAYSEDDGGADAGAAYIFWQNFGSPNNWGQVKKLVASDAQTFDRAGLSVSIFGDYAVLGAHNEDAGGSNAGAAYIFSRDQGGINNWGEIKKLIASDAQVDDFFGISVSIDNEYVVVGARWEDTNGSNSGAAYIFNKDQGGIDNWGQVQKILASDGESGDIFGFALNISGDYILIGARDEDEFGSDAGATYVFKNDGGTWSQLQKITASDASSSDEYGYGVAINGGNAIIGATKEDENENGSSTITDAGSVYMLILSSLLPVELLSFQVTRKYETAVLKWQTASEQNNKGFYIERSKNSIDWESLDFIKGKGNTTNLSNYKFVDDSPHNGLNYYRLKQVDTDGGVDFSPLITVNIDREGSQDVSIGPNPVKDEINIHFMNTTSAATTLEVFDLFGRLVLHRKLAANIDQSVLDLNHLRSGIYWLRITQKGNSFAEIQHFIKL